MHFTPPFNEWLKQRRRELDLTQEQLAQRASYSVDAIRKYESGASQPSRQAAELLADALDVPAEQHKVFVDFARGTSLPRIDNLPNPATSLVGREGDISAIVNLLRDPDTRMVTLVGPPGVGKTRLSIEVARRALPFFQQGVCFVPLAHITEPSYVPGVVGDRLGLLHHQATGVPAFLRDRQLLLVLDNFEQVLDGASHIAEWLSAAPELKVLVTSRAVLHQSAEHIYPVEPLVLPDMQHIPAVHEMEHVPAVALFMQRAQAAKPTVALTTANAHDIATICNYLDGLPLALELAAGRVRMFTPHTLVDRLNHVVGARLRFLVAGSHDLPARQQTLLGAIEWSNALLADSEQRLLRRLGIFVNGFTLEAAQAVCAEPDQNPEAITTDLQTLVDHSLVQMREGLKDEPRYMLLESLRDFALEQLTTHGELEMVRQQHARYYGNKSDFDNNAPSWAYEATDALRWVASERANLSAAMQASRAYDDEPKLHLNITGVLIWLGTVGHDYWGISDRYPLYYELEWSLARNPNLPLARRAKAVCGLGLAAYFRDSPHNSLAMFEQAAALSHAAGAFQYEAIMLGFVAAHHFMLGDFALAKKYIYASLKINQERLSDCGIMGNFAALGRIALCEQDYPSADELLNKALVISRRAGFRASIGGGETTILLTIGVLAYKQRDCERACSVLELVLKLCTEVGEVPYAADAHLLLALALMARGDLDAAEHHLRLRMIFEHDYGWQPDMSSAYRARLAQLRGDAITFTRLAGYVAAHPPRLRDEFVCLNPEINQLVVDARAGLSDPALAAAWAAGQALSDAEALDEVL